MSVRAGLLFLCAVACAGCGGPAAVKLDVVPAKGVVTLDGQPLANADVTAIPLGDTEGAGGTARTNAQGEFSITHFRGEPGLPKGEYRVTVSLRKLPDGSVPPVNDPTPPIESPAVETLPPAYSQIDTTTLRWNLAADGAPTTFALKASGK